MDMLNDLSSLDLGSLDDLNLDGLDDTAADESDVFANVKYTGKLEKDLKAELNEVQAAFANRQKKEAQRFALATDSEFWVVLCFETREQKAEFVLKAGLGDPNDKYVSGFAAAKRMNIEIEAPRVLFPNLKEDTVWADNLGLIDD